MIPVTKQEIIDIKRAYDNPNLVLCDIPARKYIHTLLAYAEQLQTEIDTLQNSLELQQNIIDKYETALKAISGLSSNLVQTYAQKDNYLPIPESTK